MDRVTIHRDVMSGGVLLALAAVYYSASRDLPPGRGEPGPAFFPVLLSGILAILAVTLVVRGWQSAARTSARAPDTRRVVGAIGLTILYVAAFNALGFLVSTWLYALSVTLIFRQGRSLLPVFWPIVATLAIYLLFDVGLGARLPAGILW